MVTEDRPGLPPCLLRGVPEAITCLMLVPTRTDCPLVYSPSTGPQAALAPSPHSAADPGRPTGGTPEVVPRHRPPLHHQPRGWGTENHLLKPRRHPPALSLQGRVLLLLRHLPHSQQIDVLILLSVPCLIDLDAFLFPRGNLVNVMLVSILCHSPAPTHIPTQS